MIGGIGVLLQLLKGTHASAQSTGTLRIFCEPTGTSEYVLDGKYRMRDREVTALEGPHRFVFWAPERRILDTTLLVLPNVTTDVRVQLHYSEEYIAYRHKADRFSRNEGLLRYGPPVLTTGAAAWLGFSIWKNIDAQNKVDQIGDDYAASSSPSGINEIKGVDLPKANQRLRNARSMTYVSGGVFAVSAAAWWYVCSVRKNKTAPVFEDKERVRFDGLVWTPTGEGNGMWLAGLTIPIR